MAPFDLIPEGVVGPSGYRDDLVLAAYVVERLEPVVGAAALRERWHGSGDPLDGRRGDPRRGGGDGRSHRLRAAAHLAAGVSAPGSAAPAPATAVRSRSRSPARASGSATSPRSTASRSSCAPGELLGLLGPNGAGKTTLVRALAGRVRLDGGSIELFGRPLPTTTRRAGLGVVPQEIALYPLLTARENLEVFGRLQRPARRRRCATASPGRSSGPALAERAREPVKRFSGGMKRRLNIACGVLHEPRGRAARRADGGRRPAEPRAHLRDARRAARRRRRRCCSPRTTSTRPRRAATASSSSTTAAWSPPARWPSWSRDTVGEQRAVTATLDRAPGRAARRGSTGDAGDGTLRRDSVRDVDAELPALLRARARGGVRRCTTSRCAGRACRRCSSHLTGRELRE